MNLANRVDIQLHRRADSSITIYYASRTRQPIDITGYQARLVFQDRGGVASQVELGPNHATITGAEGKIVFNIPKWATDDIGIGKTNYFIDLLELDDSILITPNDYGRMRINVENAESLILESPEVDREWVDAGFNDGDTVYLYDDDARHDGIYQLDTITGAVVTIAFRYNYFFKGTMGTDGDTSNLMTNVIKLLGSDRLVYGEVEFV